MRVTHGEKKMEMIIDVSRPERADFRPERADYRPERADFRPERA